MTPAKSSPSSCWGTSAARLVRQAKKVKAAATKVQTQALMRPSLVGLHGVGGVALQNDQPAGAGGLVEDQAQKLRGPAFGLAKAGHEQAGEGDQPGPGLTWGDAGRQRAAGGATAPTDEPVPLIFRNERLDFRQFPDLMADRLGIGPRQRSAAAPAGSRHAEDDLAALLRWNQRPLVFWVAGLAAG